MKIPNPLDLIILKLTVYLYRIEESREISEISKYHYHKFAITINNCYISTVPIKTTNEKNHVFPKVSYYSNYDILHNDVYHYRCAWHG